jgi:hypothetical protein
MSVFQFVFDGDPSQGIWHTNVIVLSGFVAIQYRTALRYTLNSLEFDPSRVLIKIDSYVARNMVARGKRVAQRSASPLDSRVTKSREP